jgi:hypothetical protein
MITIAVAVVLLIVIPLLVFGIGSNEDSSDIPRAAAAL